MLNFQHSRLIFKQITGVEPASKAWEAFILPMNYVRMPYGCCTSRDEHAQPNEARIVILARHLPTRVE